MSLSSRLRMDAWKRRWIASGCFVAMGLWPKRCATGTARLDFAGSEPAGGMGGLLPHCRRIAAFRGPCGRPVVAAVGRHVPRGQEGIGLGPAGVALAGCPRFARCADVAAPEAAVAPVRFVSHGTCRVFTRRSRVRVPRFRRRCAASLMRTRTGRPNVAARDGAGLVSGRIIGQSGGVWQRLGGGAAGNCVNAGSARPRYVGRCGAPSHSGGARHAVGLASVVSVNGALVALLVSLGAPPVRQAERARHQRSLPNGPRPRGGLGPRQAARARAAAGGGAPNQLQGGRSIGGVHRRRVGEGLGEG